MAQPAELERPLHHEPQWRRIYRALTALEMGAVITDAELRTISGGTESSTRTATRQAINYAEYAGYAFARITHVGYRSARTSANAAPYWDIAELMLERFGPPSSLASEAHREPSPLRPPAGTITERRRILCAALDN